MEPDSVCSVSDVVEETVSVLGRSEVEAVIGGTVESDDVDAAGAELAEEVRRPRTIASLTLRRNPRSTRLQVFLCPS